jgi:hypothetical protein
MANDIIKLTKWSGSFSKKGVPERGGPVMVNTGCVTFAAEQIYENKGDKSKSSTVGYIGFLHGDPLEVKESLAEIEKLCRGFIKLELSNPQISYFRSEILVNPVNIQLIEIGTPYAAGDLPSSRIKYSGGNIATSHVKESMGRIESLIRMVWQKVRTEKNK